jgi:glycosyltransferase involved in cell wall biosynthesis
MENFSFVICSRHFKKVLTKAMESVLSQSVPGDEYVLVINQKDAAGYPENFLKLFHQIIFSQSIGCGAARNTGVIAASHEMIAFVDDDTELLAHWRKNSSSYLQNSSIAFYQARRAGKPTLLDVKARKPFLFFFDTAGSVFRKTLVLAVGNFDRDLERCEDTDMATRIFYAGWDSAIGSITVKDLEPESISYRMKRLLNSLKPNALLHLRAGLRLKHPSLFHLPKVVHKMGHSFLKRNTYEVLLTFIPVFLYQNKLSIVGYPMLKRQKKALLQFDGAVYLLTGPGRIVYSEDGLTLIHIGEGRELFIRFKDFSIDYNESFVTIKMLSDDILFKEFFLQSGVLTVI